ncbi:Uncharacterised protein [Serratia liquefaciens]|nr:Uncharacterised protein [Serratia liquefaciens]
MLLRFDDGSKGSFMVSQVSAGRKNRLAVEINGSLCSLAWDQEVPPAAVDRPPRAAGSPAQR